MENPNMALLSSSSSSCPKPSFFTHSSSTSPIGLRRHLYFSSSPSSLPFALRSPKIIGPRTSRVSACIGTSTGKLGGDGFASLSSGNSQQTHTSVGSPNLSVPPPSSSSVGSPLFWVGVGVAMSAIFSFAASRVKQYMVQQAFKTMMNQVNPQNNQFGNVAFPPGSPFSSAFPPGSPFPYPPPSAAGPTEPSASSPSTPAAAASKPIVTVDVPAKGAEAASTTDFKDERKENKEEKKYAFVDVSPEETMQKSPFENYEDVKETSLSDDTRSLQDSLKVNQNGAAFKQVEVDSQEVKSTRKKNPYLSVEALEKLIEDPAMQKMIYPYLPEEMRDPTTFKWMLQNPQYRQQLEEMIDNMSGNAEWDSQMMKSLENFDLNSPDVKQQFDQLGVTPEEVISKIMANPDVAMAFQNPKVQAAIMDCSQNPMSILKYQNDQEIMDVFNKIQALFPGVTG